MISFDFEALGLLFLTWDSIHAPSFLILSLLIWGFYFFPQGNSKHLWLAHLCFLSAGLQLGNLIYGFNVAELFVLSCTGFRIQSLYRPLCEYNGCVFSVYLHLKFIKFSWKLRFSFIWFSDFQAKNVKLKVKLYKRLCNSFILHRFRAWNCASRTLLDYKKKDGAPFPFFLRRHRLLLKVDNFI